MKAVIPGKASSIRVPNKNFRDFANDKSLFDVTASKIVPLLGADSIYLSSEDDSKKIYADTWGMNFILREPRLVDNDTPFYDVFNGVCDQVPGDDDIAWCALIDPLFNSYKECFDIWDKVRNDYDSLVVVYPHKGYYLDADHRPEGFGFGTDHIKSQLLPIKYQLTFVLSILTRESIKQCGYFVGNNPYWYHATNSRIDIDTLEEFNMAGKLYSTYFL